MPNTREKLIELLDTLIQPGQQNTLGEIADYFIANGVTVQKWIPVSEPPQESGCYLVTVKHWLDGKPVSREAFWNSEDWLSCERSQEITPRVTHWMPLPEPPKGE